MASKSFRSLAAAAAHCEKLGLGYDCVSERNGRRYVVKGNPSPSSNPRRKRKRGKETKAEREARLESWRDLREDIRDSKDRERGARETRDEELVDIGADCDTRRKQTTTVCKARRGEARDDYQDRRDMAAAELAKSGLRYTKSESDSLAEQNVPDDLIPIWRKLRHKISYSMQPDDRAVRFIEIYAEDRENLEAAEWAEHEARGTDEALWREYQAAQEAEPGDTPF
ncbi:hypothetical protein LCGC14_0798620 [marine sediment metagenome]|uniref:Uncharacterized protein n=1 Tax=marine sediment metagenome TaxID=412755 RepID=A0A0F9PUS6_9ZZZZ